MSSIISSSPVFEYPITFDNNNVKFTLRFPVTLTGSHVIGRRARAVTAEDFVLALSSYSYLLHLVCLFAIPTDLNIIYARTHRFIR